MADLTLDEVMGALRAADAAGDAPAATRLAEIARSLIPKAAKPAAPKGPPVDPKWVPDSAPPPEPVAPQSTGQAVKQFLVDQASRVVEAPLAIGTGMAGSVAGAFTGLGRRALGASDADAAEAGTAVQDALTYRPKNQAGQDLVEGFGHFMQGTGIEGVPMGTMNKLGRVMPAGIDAMRPVAGAAVARAADAAITLPERVRRKFAPAAEPDMSGVGAARVAQAKVAQDQAMGLDVPMDNMSKAQLTRDFADQQFESQITKDPDLGETLRQDRSRQRQILSDNFDAFYDQTGAEAKNLRFTGIKVVDAILAKMKAAKEKIDAAYTRARDAGEMRELVSTAPLDDLLYENRNLQSAPIIGDTKTMLDNLVDRQGNISINDLEEIRKKVGGLGKTDGTAAHYAIEIKKVIDGILDVSGGDEYKGARAMYNRYAEEFKRTSVIRKLVETKRGTNDRIVALEDVMKHSLLEGPLDDVRHVRSTLQREGPQGQAAWQELRGTLIHHMRETVFKSATKDSFGRDVPSAHAFNEIVKTLDADGKLDFIFGKVNAQKIRNLNEVSQRAFTFPDGTVNASNNAGLIVKALAGIEAGITGGLTHLAFGVPIPAPVLSATRYAIQKAKDRATKKRIEEHRTFGQSLEP